MNVSFTTEGLPYSWVGDCPKGGSGSNGCWTGSVYFLPTPSPPWDKAGMDIPYTQSLVDQLPWCAAQEGILPRR